MTSLDYDNDGTPDGIINLFDYYFDETGNADRTGVWSVENSLSLPLNEITGEVELWEYRYSSVSNLAVYEFKLLTTDCNDINNPAATITINLGSYSGIALQASLTNDINLEICDYIPENGVINYIDGLNEIDLFEALASDELTPAPHLNGTWVEISRPTNISYFELKGNILKTKVIYQQGTPLVDKAEFQFKYVMPETPTCGAQETNIKVSVVRHVDAGNNYGLIPKEILITKSNIESGIYDNDIDLRDDIYLADEDIEGYWTGSSYLNPDDRTDSVVNIKEIYDNYIANNPTFYDNFTESFFHNVDKRSGVCGNNSAKIQFTFIQELEPFTTIPGDGGISGSCFSICLNDQSQVNLYEYIDFTEEDGITYDYNDDNFVNWRYNRELGSDVETSDFQLNEQPDFLLEFDPSIDYYLGTINLENIPPGEYEFQYAVSSKILNTTAAGFCDPYDSILEDNYCEDPYARGIQTVKICILIEDYEYAGEDTVAVEFCETDEDIILTDYLEKLELLGEVATTGIWTDISGTVYSNNFALPSVDADTAYELTYTTTHPTSGCQDSAVLNFKIINETPKGSAGESINPDGIVRVCSDNLNINLFDQLQNADDFGTWTGPRGYVSADNIGEFSFNNMILARLSEGVYTYSVGDGEDCTSITTTTITIELIEPIILGAPIYRTYCKNVSSVDLLDLLDPLVTTTGNFIDESASGALTGSVFDFGSLSQGGIYNFSYNLDTTPCADPNQTQAIVIEIIDDTTPPTAGSDAPAPVKVCSNNLTINLFDKLGGNPSISGAWSGPFGYQSTEHLQPYHLGQFDSSKADLPILGPGKYIYTVGGDACNTPITQSEVIIEFVEPIALGDNIIETFCKSDASVNLIALLDNTTTISGTFTELDTIDGLNDNGDFDFSDLDAGIYNFSYSVPNSAPCDVSSLNVAINIVELAAPVTADAEFCILDAKKLQDITVYNLKIPEDLEDPYIESDNFRWYSSLQIEEPIITNPILFDGDVYYVANLDAQGCESERLTVEVSILNVGEKSLINSELKCPLEFQDGVSVDGNGINDTFSPNWKSEEYNLNLAFPDYKLEIFNRYGVVVYKGNPNTDEFDGNSNVSLSIGSDLPSGVYFYLFNPNFKNNKPVQGSFYLSK